VFSAKLTMDFNRWQFGEQDKSMLDRKTAADLYLNLLVPWEKMYKDLPQKGEFDIRSKEFTTFKRDKKLLISVFNTKAEAHKEISENKAFSCEAKQIVLFQKGDNSRARSLFKHFRNSIAHAHVKREKIQNRWFLIFEAEKGGKSFFKAQVLQSRLSEFIAALKSTAKNVWL